MKKDTEKEKLVEEVYEWVTNGSPVPLEKERLVRMMIEATLDYLYLKKVLFRKTKPGKEN